MNKNETTINVLGDLTALFAARSQRRSINYEKLSEVLKSTMGVTAFSNNNWYTLFSPGNEGQVSFVKGLKEMGWNVSTKSPRDIPRGLQAKDYRFTGQVGLQMGLAANDADKLLIVSDDSELISSIQALQDSDDEIEVTVAFFGTALDGRWHKFLSDPNCTVNFIDLDEELYKE